MFDRYYDEIEIGESRRFDGGTVSETHVVNFAGLVGDHFPLHVNAEYAAESQFGQQVAHGFLVLSLSSGMFPMKPGAVVAFYGMDEVRFIKPTFFGDTLHIVQEVIEKRDREPGGVVSVRQQIINQRDEIVNSAILRILMASSPDN